MNPWDYGIIVVEDEASEVLLLKRAFQQAGLKTADNALQFTLRDQSFGGGNQDSAPRPDMARLLVSDPELPANEPTASGYGRSLLLGNGIDIRV